MSSPPKNYFTKVPSNTAAFPRTPSAPEMSASTFGTCNWTDGVDFKAMCGICPKGWECNEYSLLCEDPSGKYSCAPRAFHLS